MCFEYGTGGLVNVQGLPWGAPRLGGAFQSQRHVVVFRGGNGYIVPIRSKWNPCIGPSMCKGTR